jgi:protease-4
MRRLVVLALAALVVGMLAYALFGTGPDIPDSAVLLVELDGELEEAPPLDPLDRFTARGPAVATLLLQLDKARVDRRIAGVLVHIRGLRTGYAHVQELRDALQRVRDAGKPVVALLDLNNLNATREVYLASAAEKVFVAPGYLGPLSGVAGEYLFLGGMFEKLGVEVQYESAGKYKSAPEMLAGRAMSDAARENTNELLDQLYAQIVQGIAAGRRMQASEVRELIERAPSTGDEFLAERLADGIASRKQALKEAGLEGSELLKLQDYAEVDPTELGLRKGPAVALVFGSGSIVQGTGGRGLRRNAFSADRISRALEEASESEKVRAIVLRVDSPGGSSLASDQIWRAIREARERKPVVVSMADAAASGGYYLASAADAIVAEPATFTGSIGVFFLRPVLGGLYRKLDIGSEVMARGRYAGMAGSSESFTEEQRARARHFVETLYGEFLARVSTGRGLSIERVRELAEGRVWLGGAARELGLVDEIGGLDTAVARAKTAAGIAPEQDPERIIFPGPRTFAEQLRDLTSGMLARSWLEAPLLERLPGVVRAWLDLAEGEPAYLPAHWLAID